MLPRPARSSFRSLDARWRSCAELIALPCIQARRRPSRAFKKVEDKVAVCLIRLKQAVCRAALDFNAIGAVAISLIGIKDVTEGQGHKLNTCGDVVAGNIGCQCAVDRLIKSYPDPIVSGRHARNADIENE